LARQEQGSQGGTEEIGKKAKFKEFPTLPVEGIEEYWSSEKVKTGSLCKGARTSIEARHALICGGACSCLRDTKNRGLVNENFATKMAGVGEKRGSAQMVCVTTDSGGSEGRFSR